MSDVHLSAKEERDRDVISQSMIMVAVATAVLTVLGIIMVFSATAAVSIQRAWLTDFQVSMFAEAKTQAVYGALAMVLMIAAIAIPMRFYQRFATPLFLAGLALQFLVLTSFGVDVAGNRNWIELGPVRLQPSEFLKLATVVWLAAVLAKKKPAELTTIRAVMVPAGFGAFVGLVGILGGRDMGTAMVYALIIIGLMWLGGVPSRWLLILGLVGTALAGVLVATERSRINRFSSFFENLFVLPDTVEPTQADFAQWAFGTGGIGGVGLGASREKWAYLAEAHNDFIFAIIGEEMGLGGAIFVIIMFLMLGLGLIRIAIHHHSRFGRLVASGVFLWIFGQGVANMLVVTGLLPVFGVPLPFISQGGSALVACLVGIGVVLSCARTQPGVSESFRLRRSLRTQSTVRSHA